MDFQLLWLSTCYITLRYLEYPGNKYSLRGTATTIFLLMAHTHAHTPHADHLSIATMIAF
jgi:hypothetical protein